MKKFYFVLAVGFILLFFLDNAFRVENRSLEMLIHNLVRFFAGFVFLGIWVWYEHKLRFKISMYIILSFIVADDIYDYIRDIDSLRPEVLIHDLFVILWGAMAGFFFVKYLNDKTIAESPKNLDK